MISINKKLKILISSCLVSAIFVSLPFQKSIDVKALVGVDDAILIATLGTLAIGTVAIADYSLNDGELCKQLATTLTDDIQSVGNSLKSAWNCASFGMNTIGLSDKLFKSYVKNLQGKEITENICNYVDMGNGYYAFEVSPFVLGSKFTFSIPYMNRFYLYLGSEIGKGGPVYDSIGEMGPITLNGEIVENNGYLQVHFTTLNGGNFGWSSSINKSSNGYLWYMFLTSNPSSVSNTVVTGTYSPIEKVSNPTKTISLDKSKAEEIAQEYIEKNPDDNDNEPDYDKLIPFIFDILEEPLGDGTIIPKNLVDSGIVSYEYSDGTVQGQYPYSQGIDINDNFNVDNNITINNNLGSDVSEEEKDGILNFLDNGLRSTTERLQSLGASLTGFNENMKSLFLFLPDDVTNLIFLGICLTIVFFILGLRR